MTDSLPRPGKASRRRGFPSWACKDRNSAGAEEELAQRDEALQGTHHYTERLNWRTCVVMYFRVIQHVL